MAQQRSSEMKLGRILAGSAGSGTDEAGEDGLVLKQQLVEWPRGSRTCLQLCIGQNFVMHRIIHSRSSESRTTASSDRLPTNVGSPGGPPATGAEVSADMSEMCRTDEKEERRVDAAGHCSCL
jgi:hypothetical protein